MAIRTATDSTFDETVEQSGVVLVEFWAPWSAPCRMLAPVLDEIDADFEGRLQVVRVNADEEGPLVARFQIMSIPTLLLLCDGKPAERISGFQSKKALADLIRPYCQ